MPNLKIWLKQSILKGQIDTIKMKLVVPGSLARIPNWRENLLDQLREKEEELMRIQSLKDILK